MNALSVLFCMHELKESHDWLVLLGLTGDREYTISQLQMTFTIMKVVLLCFISEHLIAATSFTSDRWLKSTSHIYSNKLHTWPLTHVYEFHICSPAWNLKPYAHVTLSPCNQMWCNLSWKKKTKKTPTQFVAVFLSIKNTLSVISIMCGYLVTSLKYTLCIICLTSAVLKVIKATKTDKWAICAKIIGPVAALHFTL